MDLRILVERYEQQRHFWAREIAEQLGGVLHRTKRRLLHGIAASSTPVVAHDLIQMIHTGRKATVTTRETQSNRHCKELEALHLLIRRRQSRGGYARPYTYALTELGHLVLLYLDSETAIAPNEDSETAIAPNEDSETAIAPNEARPKKNTWYYNNLRKGMCGNCGKIPPRHDGASLCEDCTELQHVKDIKRRGARIAGATQGG